MTTTTDEPAEQRLTPEQVSSFLHHLHPTPLGNGITRRWMTANAAGWSTGTLSAVLRAFGAIVASDHFSRYEPAPGLVSVDISPEGGPDGGAHALAAFDADAPRPPRRGALVPASALVDLDESQLGDALRGLLGAIGPNRSQWTAARIDAALTEAFGDDDADDVADLIRTGEVGDIAEALVDAGLRHADRALAVALRGDDWRIVVPLDASKPDTLDAPVAVVAENAPTTIVTWAAMADPAWWLTPDSQLRTGSGALGGDGDRQWPFALDGATWEGLEVDHADGHGEWRITIDDDRIDIDLASADLRYRDPLDDASPPYVVEIASSGESASTGDIGLSITVDERSLLWISAWGALDVFWGRVAAGFAWTDKLSTGDSIAQSIDSIVSIETDLDATALQPLVSWIAELDENFDPDELEITCADFEGTHEEFLELVTP